MAGSLDRLQGCGKYPMKNAPSRLTAIPSQRYCRSGELGRTSVRRVRSFCKRCHTYPSQGIDSSGAGYILTPISTTPPRGRKPLAVPNPWTPPSPLVRTHCPCKISPSSLIHLQRFVLRALLEAAEEAERGNGDSCHSLNSYRDLHSYLTIS